MYGNFYEGKKFLVTGVVGVKGTWLALGLLEAGSEVVGIDIRNPPAESNFVASGLGRKIDFVQQDVAEASAMQKLLDRVDGVFHLAAVAIVGIARREPWETYRSNTLGTASILEALRLSDVRRAVFVTTDKVYATKPGDAWNEDDPLGDGTTGPYPTSKVCAELIIRDYYNCYLKPAGKLLGIGRAGNVLVGGDFNTSSRTGGAGRIFADCYEALEQGKPPEIFTPHFTRPYTYGLDIISGYMTLMQNLERDGVAGEAFNFGPHEHIGVANAFLATKICETWDAQTAWQTGTSRPEPFETQSLSWQKAHRRLGWSPAFSLHEAIVQTTRWYREWATRGKSAGEGGMHEVNRSLLSAHRQAAARLGIPWAANP